MLAQLENDAGYSVSRDDEQLKVMYKSVHSAAPFTTSLENHISHEARGRIGCCKAPYTPEAFDS